MGCPTSGAGGISRKVARLINFAHFLIVPDVLLPASRRENKNSSRINSQKIPEKSPEKCRVYFSAIFLAFVWLRPRLPDPTGSIIFPCVFTQKASPGVYRILPDPCRKNRPKNKKIKINKKRFRFLDSARFFKFYLDSA